MPLTSATPVTPPTHQVIGEFADCVFNSLPRADQRRWAETYLQGILFAQGRRSVRGIADSVGIFRANQSLQQFINQSPWKWEPVRRLVTRHLQSARPARAWVVDRVVIPKRGQRSVGVQRRFVPELGRSVNSQLILAMSLAGENSAVPVNWRIALNGDWCTDDALRQAAYIPDEARGRSEGAEILDMIDEMRFAWQIAAAPITGDLRHVSDAEKLIGQLMHIGAEFSLQVDGNFPLGGTRWLPSLMDLRENSHGSKERGGTTIAQLLNYQAQQPAGGEYNTRGADGHRTRIVSTLARPNVPRAGIRAHVRPLRVIGEFHPDSLTRFWVSNLVEHNLADILAVNRIGVRSWRGHGIPESEFGLREFEGRSFRGLHHHLTMVSAAFAFVALEGREFIAEADE